jgi:signal transduction histidine kinase
MRTKLLKIRDDYLGDISKKSGLKIPYFVFTISVIVTVAVTFYFYNNAKTIDSQRFANDVIKIDSALESRLDTHITLLRAGRGFFRATNNINRQRFTEFVENLELKKFYPGVQGIGYSKVFTAAEKANLENRIREEGYLDFQIKPDTEREIYQSTIYIEPFDGLNKKAHGFDMSTDPVRRQALEIARDTGNYATSGKVNLLDEGEGHSLSGFLIFLPVYKGEQIPETLEERQRQLDGFIFSPFRAGDFVKDVINESKTNTVYFKIYDSEIGEKNLLAIGNDFSTISNSDLSEQTEIDVGGRKWIITYKPLTTFRAQSLTWWTPIIFLLGLLTGVILFVLSLSQTRTNIKLFRLAKELTASEAEVQKLLASEQKARETAEKSNRVKDEFISVVSHEMRTPLNAIGGWVEILKHESIDDQTRDRALDKIKKNLRSQVGLVEEMIDFSDESFLQHQDRWQKVSLAEIIEECLSEKIEEIQSRKIHISEDFRDEGAFIRCDREKIKKAILNLLDNAAKFTPVDGLITVKTRSRKKMVELKITDSGEGINSEQLPTIFEIFNQSDTSTTRKYEGLGVGLANARKIIKGHGGKITARSEGSGQGSTFTIMLPISKD